MSIFRVGSIVASMGLDVGGWNRSVAGVLRQSLHIRQNLNMILRDVAAVGRMMGLMGAASLYAFQRVGAGFIDVARKVENTTIALEQFTRSEKTAADFMEELIVYGTKVPFSIELINQAATTLTGTFKGNIEQVKAWLPIMSDMMAFGQTVGIRAEDFVYNFNRALTAGIQNAEILRERMAVVLGFKPGQAYTGRETAAKIIEEWEKVDSVFRGMSQRMMQTYEGQLSNLQDTWFQFKKMVMDAGVFDFLKTTLGSVNRAFAENKDVIKNWITENKAAILDTVLLTGALIALVTVVSIVTSVVLPMVTVIQGTVLAFYSLGQVIAKVTLLQAGSWFLGAIAGAVGLAAAITATIATVLLIGGAIIAVRATWIQNNELIKEHWGSSLNSMADGWKSYVHYLIQGLDMFKNAAQSVFSGTVRMFTKLFTSFSTGAVLGAEMDRLEQKYLKQMQGDDYGKVSPTQDMLLLAQRRAKRNITELDKLIQQSKEEINNEDFYGGVKESTLGVFEQIKTASADTWGDIKAQTIQDISAMTEAVKSQFPGITKFVNDFRSAAGSGAPAWDDNYWGFKPNLDLLGGETKDTAGANKAAKEAARLLEEISRYRLDIYPKEKLAEELRNLQEFAKKAPNMIDPVTMSIKMQELFNQFTAEGDKQIKDWTGFEEILSSRVNPAMVELWKVNAAIADETKRTLDQMKDMELGMDQKLEAGKDWLTGGADFETQLDHWATLHEQAREYIEMMTSGENPALTPAEGENLFSKRYLQDVADAATQTLGVLTKQLNAKGTTMEQKVLIKQAIMKKFKEDFNSLVIDPIMHFGNALDEIGAKKIGGLIKFMGRMTDVFKRGSDYIKEIPALMASMAGEGVKAAVKIGTAMHIAFNILALIADVVVTIISLFGDMGGAAKEELSGVAKVIDEIKDASSQWAEEFTDAMITMAKTGEKTFKEFANSVIEDIFRIAFTEMIVNPAVRFIGDKLPGFAKGGAFDKGGIVSSPTNFAFAGGMAEMGEEKPEAVMPLMRGRDGRLGVKEVGGGRRGGNMIVNIQAHGIPAENVSVSETREHSDGTREIDVIVHNSMRRGIHQGKFNRDFAAVFQGMRRRTS